jgi:REP element-mobilizing transposase RayT
MPRAPRDWEPGGLYLLSPKGNDARNVFLDDDERAEMLKRCNAVLREHNVLVIGFCFMDNHLHFLVRADACDLSAAMHVLLGGYARWWNNQHKRKGHLFESRFHASHIRTELHFLTAVRYVDMNPVAAGMVAKPEDWKWSSYRAHVGLERPMAFLANAEFFKYFGRTRTQAIANYLRLVSAWRPPDPSGRTAKPRGQWPR